jgi:hypothetical protein
MSNSSLLCDDFVVKIRHDFVTSKRYNFHDSRICKRRFFLEVSTPTVNLLLLEPSVPLQA